VRIVYLRADRGIPLLGAKGASVHLRSLAAALARRGNGTILACRRLDGDNPLPSAVSVERLPSGKEEQPEWIETLLRDAMADVLLERYSLDSGPGLEAAGRVGARYVLEVNAPLVEEAACYRGLSETAACLARERSLIARSDRIIAVSSGIGDIGRLTGALRRLFDDEEARGHLGRTAWARSRTLSWDRVAWRVERVLGGEAQAA